MTTPYSTLHTPRLVLTVQTLPDDLAFRRECQLSLFPLAQQDAARKTWTSSAIAAGIALTERNHLLAAPNGPAGVCYIVRLRSTEEPIGITLYYRRVEGTVPAELAFIFLPAFHGQGFATEAVREMLRHLREDHGAKEMMAATLEENEGAKKVVAKCGFVKGGWLVMDGLFRGAEVVMKVYVLDGMKKVEGDRVAFMWAKPIEESKTEHLGMV